MFNFNGRTRQMDAPENRVLAGISQGFWVDVDLEWCVLSKAKYWIPPSQIQYIVKVEIEEGQ
jgi:hypothetical protein